MVEMAKIFIIDAYDSFVYMLYQYLGELAGESAEIKVVRNDKFKLSDIREFDPDYIILSPGPGHPKDSHFIPVLHEFSGTPTFGVCLGHQALGLAFGAKIICAKNILHGKVSSISHDGKTIFSGLPNPFTATRYHSLMATEPPAELIVSARSKEDNEIMAFRHAKYPFESVQFHPESVMTQNGKMILKNFLEYYR